MCCTCVRGSTVARAKLHEGDRFTIDITQKARDGKIDPVFGREVEIRQMVDILARRRKNNPILVGEPRVGKTALVEGLALKIIEGDVPAAIRNVSVHTLDLGLLQAGVGVKGEFEQRLKNVIEDTSLKYEPRLKSIDIARADPEDSLLLSFTMSCELHQAGLVRYGTYFTPDAQARLTTHGDID